MFNRMPIRSAIGIRRASHGSNVRTYRPNLSTLHHHYPCATDLTTIPTTTGVNRRMSRTKTEKGADHHGVSPPFWRAEGRFSIDPRTKPTLRYHREYPYPVSKL
jgi:hypothetical protein